MLLLRSLAVIVRGLRSAAAGSAEGGREGGREDGRAGAEDEDSQVGIRLFVVYCCLVYFYCLLSRWNCMCCVLPSRCRSMLIRSSEADVEVCVLDLAKQM